ncbi:hypothetical protein [Helicobacter bilis]|uniref:Uncharacterized protein n=1 Tax=Helicobacter bilis TaxID=37372 RepID=A0A4U8UAK6_9HELI|nr:hypothetical protein [Helicobacter bilis]MDY4399639.1 hypothetical protein [Helicobacter bilis]TLE07573.1 hypothetical protein LS78_008685 [Helicobacter bilis]TLE09103.1 hypothetical protein LS79_008555 [Helicobacter bilis]
MAVNKQKIIGLSDIKNKDFLDYLGGNGKYKDIPRGSIYGSIHVKLDTETLRRLNNASKLTRLTKQVIAYDAIFNYLGFLEKELGADFSNFDEGEVKK